MSPSFKSTDRTALFFLLHRYALPYWRKITCLVSLSVLAAFTMPLTALVLAPALHIITLSSTAPAECMADLSLNNFGPTLLSVLHINSGNTWHVIVSVVIAYIFVSLVYAILNFCAYLMAMHIRTHVGRDVEVDLYSHVLSLPISFFQVQKLGDLISRFTEDARGTAYALDGIVRGILQSGIQIVVSIIILVKTEPVLAVAAFALGSGHFLITRLLGGRLKSRMVEQNAALGQLSSVLQEALLTIRVIKSFAAERFAIKRFGVEAENHRSMMMRFVFAKHLEEPLRFVADAIAVSLILLLTFQAMKAGRLSLEGFGLFIVLARQVISPISLLSTHVLATSGMLGSAQRVMEIFNTKSNLLDGSASAGPMVEKLELRDVSFGYKDHDVLQNITLTINAGETIALVGPSGAGKSTLVDLVLRFYDPVQGVIEIDRQDIRSLRQESYRKLFGVVPQECQLFNTTVLENILYGRPYNKENLQQAIDIANASEFINSMPGGLDTVLDERGMRLSGGQRQRIAIARAVYGRPSILVLDEATSSLDAESERAVQEAIDQAVQGATAIIIAHRLSTIRNASRIVVLKDGTIEAIGTHEDLMQSSTTYMQLYAMQMEQKS
ncbi:MAG: ABC transporter ATP-binding protein/permease [Proteobacteria bacterium]|nr:ABC transporter ATP-binding protein/permease [Pseudomonadota bacterium]